VPEYASKGCIPHGKEDKTLPSIITPWRHIEDREIKHILNST
jgi:hypothetical protein